jgi:hypothetical protein
VRPTEAQLDALVERVTAPIPPAPRRKAKPQKSWQGLKVGDRYTDHPVVQWEVVGCDSEGVNLRICVPYEGTHVWRVTDKAELRDYRKVRKARTRKAKEPSK